MPQKLYACLAALFLLPFSASAAGKTEITWYGHAAFTVKTPGGTVLLIDPWLSNPKAPAKNLADTIEKVDYILVTHGHFDHIGGARFFQVTYGAEVFLHAADLKTAKSSNFLLMVVKLADRITVPELTLVDPAAPPAGLPVAWLPVPGHTPGSCFIRFGDHLFSGDSLYARGVGLSDLPGENHGLLRQSLLALWDEIDGETLVHPGHGPSARFADIKAGNRALAAFLAAGDSR